MCGIVGFFDRRCSKGTSRDILNRMATALRHRGPDAEGFAYAEAVGLGFRRLAIIDVHAPSQPAFNENRSVISICNGEIYNYEDLLTKLKMRGHKIQHSCDTDLIPHLYEEYGIGLLDQIDGQFSIAIYDSKSSTLHLARDPFGITPLYYYFKDRLFLFASEIGGILAHPDVARNVNLTGLDQILSFPGLVSPETMFADIKSIPPGHRLEVSPSGLREYEYWDIDFPHIDDSCDRKPDATYVDQFGNLLEQSVRKRARSDVPTGLYISGGLDSSLIAALYCGLGHHDPRQSFAVTFEEREMSEHLHQQTLVKHLATTHRDVSIDGSAILDRLHDTVRHAEAPIKDTYNTACHALSQVARSAGISVVLTGQGADEMFAGYIGYKFDSVRAGKAVKADVAELQLRAQMWGDETVVYDGNYCAVQRLKAELYSDAALTLFSDFDSLKRLQIARHRLEGRHPIHQRSYLDLKLRLADHLLGDHGDRMAMAHSIELRHPFLSREIAEFSAWLPPDMKIRQLDEKYIVKQYAKRHVPREIVSREKFGWYAPGSPALLRLGVPWVEEYLSPARIRTSGYFNPTKVAALRDKYSQLQFSLNQPFETDILTIVLTFEIFRELFHLPSLN